MNTETFSLSEASSLLNLLRLASPALPVGAYAYSQGLEWAVENNWVTDEQQLGDWLIGVLNHGQARLEIPVLARLYQAWQAGEEAKVHDWARFLHASRESAELQAEGHQLGISLARLLADLDIHAARAWTHVSYTQFSVLFALAAVHWRIPLRAAAWAYLWSWCENQAAAAVKLMPLGQTGAQRILSRVVPVIPEAVTSGLDLVDADIGFLAPRLALATALHETQYTRLFRS